MTLGQKTLTNEISTLFKIALLVPLLATLTGHCVVVWQLGLGNTLARVRYSIVCICAVYML